MAGSPAARRRGVTDRAIPERSSLGPGVRVGASTIDGSGLFATRDLSEGDVVARMGGTVMTDAEFTHFVASRSPYSAMAIGDRLHLVQPDGDLAAAGNHSCAPNARVVDRVIVVAIRAIPAGEEITTDYALVTDDPEWSMECACGAPACRGTVRGGRSGR